ncbi:MAG: hypothetical protein AAFY72_17390, partial [Cyanobacteria bacterium J06649_4]
MNLQEQVSEQFNQAVSSAAQMSDMVSAVGTQIFNKVSHSTVETTTRVSEVATDSAHSMLEQTTETVGETL